MVKITNKQLKQDDKREIKAKQVLSRIKHKSEEDQTSTLADEYKLPYVDLNLVPLSGDDIFTVTEEESRRLGVGIIQKSGKKVRLAITDPADKKTLDQIKNVYEKEYGWTVSLYVVSESSMRRIWDKYRETPLLDNLNLLHMALSGDDLKKFEADFGDLLDLKKRIKEIPTSQIITTVLAGGVKMKASDIHLEAQEKEVRLRYRIDGVLQDIGMLPHETYRFLLSRIKIMSKMKINVRDAAQDGHFSITVGPDRVDLRVSIIPGKYGESIVMRILNQASIMVQVEELGLQGLAYEIVQKEIEKPNGMILTTGPTGSGKTTTLYALINHLNTPDVKIITIEDPVEYEIKGITQTEINREHGYTFGAGLRAIVRQDPDVVLVGEIRDEETAEVAINAALTGHLVLSTLHTNNAPASIPRFVELGVKPSLIAPAVNAFIAQRLVRKLCPNCRIEYAPAEETIETLQKILAIISPKAKVDIPKKITKLYKPVGCPECHNLGYKGRIGIFEVMTITEPIEKLIMDMAGETEITKAAMEDGMMTMAQDGILKAIEGITSIEEVWSATGQEEFLEDLYHQLMEQTYSRFIDLAEKDFEAVKARVGSFESLTKLIAEMRKRDALKTIFAGALLLGVNDVYVEPRDTTVSIRLRIDGALHTIGTMPLDDYPELLKELKFLSGMKPTDVESVIESRFALRLDKPFGTLPGREIGVQVSIVRGGFGENVVLHLLHKSAMALKPEELGLRPENLNQVLRAIQKPHGLFLIAGPVGSGKSTTLYSTLKTLNQSEVKIITLEDPIEYRMEGVLQTQVDHDAEHSIPDMLRSLVRQNPDILMVNGMDEYEVAQMVIQSALSGRRMFSTIDAQEAAEAIQKLTTIGIQTEDFASALNAILAQRLVRKLCDCKEKAPLTPPERARFDQILSTLPAGATKPTTASLYRPKGCAKCNSIGYKGRTVISEVLTVSEPIRELLRRRAPLHEIKEKAVAEGMITMAQDGILKVLEGETTLDEVERVILG